MALYQVFRLSLLPLIFLVTLTNTAYAQDQQTSSQQIGSPSVVEQPIRIAGQATIYCSGYIRHQRLPKAPEIVGAEQEQLQRNFAAGDVVYVNYGSQQGLKEGQEFQIVRPRGAVKGVYTEKKGFLGTYVQEVGQLQLVKVREATSVGQITFSCDMVMLGDLLLPLPDRVSPPQRAETTLDRFAYSSGKQIGRLMMARDGREMVTRRDVVFIDLGSEDKINAGDYLTIFRPLGTGDLHGVTNEESARGRATGFQSDTYRGGGFSIQAQRAKDSTAFGNSEGRYRYRPITTREIKQHRPPMPRKIVGEMVVLDVQARTATAIITRVAAEVHTGDWVEIQ
jgi:hypothetical protein